MSLWNKQLSLITYDDINAFCRAGIPEGAQLDYKLEIPQNVEKVVAALANTRGGIILFGVHADKTTNIPDGAEPGMASKPGISERLTQICRDRIYPPITPELSPVIAHPTDPSRVFVVARIHESIAAPHSITNATHIYIRTNDVGDRFELANLDRIAHLLKRRESPESKREQLLSRSIERFTSRFKTPGSPYFWFHICPEFPHESICELEACRYGVFDTFPARCPDGYMGIDKTKMGNVSDVLVASCGRVGDLFALRDYRSAMTDRRLGGMDLAVRLLRFVKSASQFYERGDVSHPGLLRLTVGAGGVTGLQMYCHKESSVGVGFPDGAYRSDHTCTIDEITDDESRFALVFDVSKEMFHSFDLGEPLPRQLWR
ncbi:helix-turn-helix domain-containing protein [Lacipirellula parvula]|uniref:Schlafen AlbA-2 domain-containing protein n=1 Tax=Lacipirellula parvula TaxID=2650471 RepID=A0A5K7XCC8_9BACT|nr:ATP-binding protein [Lacipirellula parvula]BBO31963.1 hypothetical protein PLANPX_1575 [Lacipirellula parvula]